MKQFYVSESFYYADALKILYERWANKLEAEKNTK